MVKDIIGATKSVGIEWPELKGKLLVVEPLEVEKDIKTKFGTSDAVRANVYVLTGPDAHDDYEDTLIFPRVLQSQTRRQIGKIVVGRLTQGEPSKGQDPPWVMDEATEKDLQKAKAFLAAAKVTSAAADDEFDADDEDEEAF